MRGGTIAGHMLHAFVAKLAKVEATHQVLATTEQYRRHCQVQFVD